MHDPVTDAPTEALIDHIRTRCHETHRRELPDLIAIARKVEPAHATDPNTPRGLTHAPEAMIPELEAHRRGEEVLFPALRAGCATKAAAAISQMRASRDLQEAALNRIAAVVTHGFRLPHHACRSWRRLYDGLGKLAEDLDEHMSLENDVLLARVEMRR